MSKVAIAALAAACGIVAASSAYAETNIIPAHWIAIGTSGQPGVLPAGNGWINGSTPSDQNAPVSGTSQPEGTQWNKNSFWWDANDYGPSTWTVSLDGNYKLDHFIVQADNNDTYQLQYWNGSSWADAWDIPGVPGWGLTSRDSGILPSITTDAFRFVATGGDGYYAVSQIEAFGAAVPEPSTWALMLAGFVGLGYAAFRRNSKLDAALL